jgi:cytosine/adenosine deaminase-related metal-dependent hydrolase
VRTLLRAAHVVGHENGDHCLIRDGDVVWEDDRLVHAGGRYDGPVDETVECGEAVVIPGLIDLNALGDIDHAIFDSFQPDELLAGQDWSPDYARDRRHEVFDRADLAFRREYAVVQLLLNGITTALPIAAETYRAWAETEEEFDDLAEIAGRLGIRMYLGPSYRAGVPTTDTHGTRAMHWDESEGERGLDGAIRFAERWDGAFEGRIRGMLAPARIETQTPELLVRTREAAARLGVPVRLHAGQSHEEVALLRERYDARPVEVLDRLGLLGPGLLVPHCWAVDTTGDDVRRLAETGTTVVFCPLASGRYAMVLDSFDSYRRAGVRMGLGTDTFPPDVLRALDHGSVLTKAVEHDHTAGSVSDLFRAATLGGAAALGRTGRGGARRPAAGTDRGPDPLDRGARWRPARAARGGRRPVRRT